ncbi:neuropeptide FF receptor 1-like [Acanthaster planci]|uniref:Neuropeptide FF receptor 1-like n=1 Tax=Acanthaster planci TaxID=133434 RepID=A0A8B7XX16_ACAPL|nr:neuropeptide FF receptor 1-like [Acanthaster planci]
MNAPWHPDVNTTEAGVDSELQPLTQTEAAVMTFTVATLAVIFVLGTVENILVCLVIAVYSQMRTVFNVLVFNLAVTDLLLGALAAPTYMARLVYEFWTVGSGWPESNPDEGILVVCHISAFTHYVCTSQSLLTMIQMGIIRAIAIFKSSKRAVFRISKLVPCALIVVNYIISLTYAALNYRKGTFTFCLDQRMRASLGVRLSSLGILVGNLAIVTVTYIGIFVGTKRQGTAMTKRREIGPAGAVATARPVNRFDIATAKSLLLVVGTYAISYLPYVVFISLWAAGVVKDEPRLMVIFPALTSLCSLVNPLIYAVNSNVFRRHLLKLVRLDKVVLRRTVPVITAAVTGTARVPFRRETPQ